MKIFMAVMLSLVMLSACSPTMSDDIAKATGRKTTSSVGLLEVMKAQFENDEYVVELFRVGCKWTAVYKNKTNQPKAPVFLAVFTSGNTTVGQEEFDMAYTQAGGEAKRYVGEQCSGHPSILRSRGT